MVANVDVVVDAYLDTSPEALAQKLTWCNKYSNTPRKLPRTGAALMRTVGFTIIACD